MTALALVRSRLPPLPGLREDLLVTLPEDKKKRGRNEKEEYKRGGEGEKEINGGQQKEKWEG